jgi:hypothetical protein
LLGESIGKLPVKLVPIIDGPASGKTHFLLMAISELIRGTEAPSRRVQGRIDIPDQQPIFEREQKLLVAGHVPAKTAGSIPDAFALRLALPKRRYLLYLYDPPGEELSSIERIATHPYFEHLDGLILLVDPFCLEGFRSQVGPEPAGVAGSRNPLNDVVAATLGAVERMLHLGRERCNIALGDGHHQGRCTSGQGQGGRGDTGTGGE